MTQRATLDEHKTRHTTFMHPFFYGKGGKVSSGETFGLLIHSRFRPFSLHRDMNSAIPGDRSKHIGMSCRKSPPGDERAQVAGKWRRNHGGQHCVRGDVLWRGRNASTQVSPRLIGNPRVDRPHPAPVDLRCHGLPAPRQDASIWSADRPRNSARCVARFWCAAPWDKWGLSVFPSPLKRRAAVPFLGLHNATLRPFNSIGNCR